MNTFQSVDDYINSFNGIARERLEEMRGIIHQCIPNTSELINYNIAAFTLIEGGKRDAQLMLAAYKNHLGFYPLPETIAYFWEELKDYKKAKGSVQFPHNKPLPTALIVKMILYRYNQLNK